MFKKRGSKRLSRNLMTMSHESSVPREDGGASGSDEEGDPSLMLSSPAVHGGKGSILPGEIAGPWLLDYDDLEFVSLMDESGFTEVYRGRYREHDVAVKKLVVTAWGPETLAEVARQARLRCRLLHPHVNAFLGYTDFPSLCLVSAWAPNGSLETLLSRSSAQHRLPLSFGRRLARDIAAGLAYLHSLRPALIHRALAPSKVLLDGLLRGVISDFTLAASLVEDGPEFARTRRVIDPPRRRKPPAPWAAPEVEKSQSYGLPCDVFSWGVVATQLGTACGGKVVSDALLTRCLATAPEQRPSSDEVFCECEAGLKGVTVELPEEGVFRVGVQEAQPGDSTTEGWQLAPKFKLAHEFLEFGDFVAEGGFSEIYRGTYKGRAVAIKKLKIWLLGEETLVEFQKEAEVLASLYHPNILVMVGITAFPSLCIVTPWAERGALDHYVYKESNALPCELACRIQLGIARGALYLHSVRILHRDMAANVLLGKHFNPRLADFGLSVRKQQAVLQAARSVKPGSDELNVSLDTGGVATPVKAASPLTPQHHLSAVSRFVSTPHLPRVSGEGLAKPVRHVSRPIPGAAQLKAEDAPRPLSTVAASHPLGTWPWQAPEVMQCQPHSEACDVYALGMTLWELWARRPPFALLSAEEVERYSRERAVYRPPLAALAHAPKDVQLLVARCWLADPAARPQMSQVVQTLSIVANTQCE